MNGDGEVTVLDITAVAERWDAFDLGNYSALYDLNCNGVIDILDIRLRPARSASISRYRCPAQETCRAPF
ncbi:MAG: dockerin type I domain-containing protein [Anaerolineae bacterium]|nr:dockerin type I domain-containing protein [Anaerolineae bacterium]